MKKPSTYRFYWHFFWLSLIFAIVGLLWRLALLPGTSVWPQVVGIAGWSGVLYVLFVQRRLAFRARMGAWRRRKRRLAREKAVV